MTRFIPLWRSSQRARLTMVSGLSRPPVRIAISLLCGICSVTRFQLLSMLLSKFLELQRRPSWIWSPALWPNLVKGRGWTPMSSTSLGRAIASLRRPYLGKSRQNNTPPAFRSPEWSAAWPFTIPHGATDCVINVSSAKWDPKHCTQLGVIVGADQSVLILAVCDL